MARARVLVLLAAVALVAPGEGSSSAAIGPPSCPRVSTQAGDVASYAQVKTCVPFFVGLNRYMPATFALVSGELPPGLSLWGSNQAAAQIDGFPTIVGTYRFTISATDASGRRATGTYTVVIHPQLVFQGGMLPGWQAGEPYSTTVPAPSGGDPPYRYSGEGSDSATGVVSFADGNDLVCGLLVQVSDASGTTLRAEFQVPVQDGELVGCDIVSPVVFPDLRSIMPLKGYVSSTVGPQPSLVTVTRVVLTGEGFTSVRRVGFAGKRAVFTIDSPTQITAYTPVGTKTGRIALVSYQGSGASDVGPRIRPGARNGPVFTVSTR